MAYRADKVNCGARMAQARTGRVHSQHQEGLFWNARFLGYGHTPIIPVSDDNNAGRSHQQWPALKLTHDNGQA